MLFWEYKADGWLWALCVRERERMREFQPDNKDPGCECVPFPFTSPVCCFLLCLAFCQCTECRDIFICWISAGYIYLFSLTSPFINWSMHTPQHHNYSTTFILRGFHLLPHLECQIQITTVASWLSLLPRQPLSRLRYGIPLTSTSLMDTFTGCIMTTTHTR